MGTERAWWLYSSYRCELIGHGLECQVAIKECYIVGHLHCWLWENAAEAMWASVSLGRTKLQKHLFSNLQRHTHWNLLILENTAEIYTIWQLGRIAATGWTHSAFCWLPRWTHPSHVAHTPPDGLLCQEDLDGIAKLTVLGPWCFHKICHELNLSEMTAWHAEASSVECSVTVHRQDPILHLIISMSRVSCCQ